MRFLYEQGFLQQAVWLIERPDLTIIESVLNEETQKLPESIKTAARF